MKKKILLFALLPVVAIVLVMIAVIGVQTWQHRQEVQKELAANATLWDEGKRAEAVEQYKRLIEKDLASMPKSDRSIVVGRVIDFEAETDKTDSAKAYIELARKQGIPLSLNGAKGQQLFAQVQTEREAADREKKDAAVRAKTEVAERAERERQEKLAAATQAEKDRKDKDDPEVRPAPPEQSIAVAAEKLANEYDANPVKADQQYKGKTLEVTGEVAEIKTGPFEAVYLVLNPKGQPVMCKISKQQVSQVADVRKGDKIKIKGKCDGKQFTVQLSDCGFMEQALKATGKKLAAFKAIVEKLDTFPDVLAPAAEKMKYADELRKLFNPYEAIPFDPKENRDEAKEIIRLFEDKVAGKYSGREYCEPRFETEPFSRVEGGPSGVARRGGPGAERCTF